jgi:DNA-binding MarR family transcriptional regulator
MTIIRPGKERAGAMPAKSRNKKDASRTNGNARRPPSRETWLRALSTADDPSHRSPPLVLYRLLKLSNLISQPFLASDAKRYNISMNELRVLATLAPLQEAASHEIGTVAGMHPMNVSRAVATLCRRKRLQQRRDPDNRRRKLLRLTAEGRALYKSLMPHVQEIADSLFATMERDELETLSRLIDKMTAQLEGNGVRKLG